jgi:uncharacterized membrane protein YqaE (UPF0057 family)
MSIAYICVKKCMSFLSNNAHNSENVSVMTRYEGGHKKLHIALHIVAGIIASYIAWMRNKGSSQIVRILISVLAFILGILYILYYIVFVQFFNIHGEKKEDLKDLLANNLMAFS